MLQKLHSVVCELQMAAIVEVQTHDELQRALSVLGSDLRVVLINNRNLASFVVDLQTTVELAPLVPRSVVTISASGIVTVLHCICSDEIKVNMGRNFFLAQRHRVTSALLSQLSRGNQSDGREF